MNGTITVDKTNSIVDPLRALQHVLSDKKDGVHVVYEFEDDAVHIGARNMAGDCFGMYSLDVNEVFTGYVKPETEVGLWDVVDFVNKVSLFDSDFTMEYNGQNLLELKNESDNVNFYTTDTNMVKKGKRKLKTELLDVGANVMLNTQVKKLSQAMSSYVGQDTVHFFSKEGDTDITVTIKSDQKNSNSYTTLLKNATVEHGVDLEFSKDQIQKILSCNDEFDVTFFTGKKNVAEFSYSKDNYSMKFYISPKSKD